MNDIGERLQVSKLCEKLLARFQEEMDIFHESISDEMNGPFAINVKSDRIIVVNNGCEHCFRDESSRPVLAAFNCFIVTMEKEGHKPMHIWSEV